MESLDYKLYDERTEKLINMADSLIICCETLSPKNKISLQLLELNDSQAFDYIKDCTSVEGIVDKTTDLLKTIYTRIKKVIDKVTSFVADTTTAFTKFRGRLSASKNVISAVRNTQYFKDTKVKFDNEVEKHYNKSYSEVAPLNYLKDRFSSISELRNVLMRYDITKFKKMRESDLIKLNNITDLKNDILSSFIRSNSSSKKKNGIELTSGGNIQFTSYDKVVENYKPTMDEFKKMYDDISVIEMFTGKLTESLNIIKEDLNHLQKLGKTITNNVENKLVSSVMLKALKIIIAVQKELVYQISALGDNLKKSVISVMKLYDYISRMNYTGQGAGQTVSEKEAAANRALIGALILQIVSVVMRISVISH